MPFFGIPIRNGLPLGLGSAAGFGAAYEFSPSELFAAGEQGAWYDPSDYSTLFQDSAGTTPVTAVEQSVGLMLDKSKNGVGTNGAYRYNLLTYSEEFDNAAWTKNQLSITSNATIAPDGLLSADLAVPTAVSAAHFLTHSTAQQAGVNFSRSLYVKPAGYKYFGIGRNVTDGSRPIIFDLASGTIAQQSSPDVYTGEITAVENGWYRINVQYSGGVASALSPRYYILPDNITFPYANNSVSTGDGTSGIYIWGAQLALSTAPTAYQRITADWPSTMAGNYAFQSTSTSRPVLRARYNLLTYSEEFDNAAWSVFAASVSANSVSAPDSTLTADTLTASVGSGLHLLQQTSSITIAANTSHTHSISVKKNNYDFVTFSVNSGSTTIWFAVTVDLSTGTISNTGAGSGGTYTSSSITDSGNGWYRITVTGSLGAQTVARTNVSISPNATPTYSSNSYVTWTAAGTEAVYIWGADLRPANQVNSFLPAYQRIAAATDYDTTGFLPYLAFDGVDDSMLTNSVDFTATDKMTVWSGVRKLSDAAAAIVTELSATVGTNNGTFYIAAPDSAAANYGIRGGGTTRPSLSLTTYTSPITNVVTGQWDIAGSNLTARVNGAQVGQDLTTQGTGNFGNYPLYIGRRNNATLPFNGNLFSLIIRGAQSTALQISDTETWVNSRTGAY